MPISGITTRKVGAHIVRMWKGRRGEKQAGETLPSTLEGSKAGSQEACGELISFVYGGMDVPEDSLEGAGNRVEALPRLKECHGVAGPWSARCYPVQTS